MQLNPNQAGRFEESDRITRRRWMVSILALTGMVLLGSLAFLNDMGLSAEIRKIGDLPGDLRRILALSELLAHGSGVIIIISIIWCLSPHLRIHLPRVAACAFLAGMAANGIKLVHARIRPLLWAPGMEDTGGTWRGWFPSFSENTGQVYDYALQSFPSAHAATAVGFAIGLSWLYPRGKLLFFFVAALAGLQRIVFLAHWPSDVCFGAAVGIFFGCCFTLRGTIGNAICDRLEWKLGLGRQLKPLSVPRKPLSDGTRKRAA